MQETDECLLLSLWLGTLKFDNVSYGKKYALTHMAKLGAMHDKPADVVITDGLAAKSFEVGHQQISQIGAVRLD